MDFLHNFAGMVRVARWAFWGDG